MSLTFLISPVPICESSALLSTSGQLSNKVSGLVYCPNCCNQIDPSKPVNEGRVYFWLYPGGYPPVWQGRRSGKSGRLAGHVASTVRKHSMNRK